MNVTLICENETINLSLSEKELQEIKKNYIKSGYNRVANNENVYYIDELNNIQVLCESKDNSVQCSKYYNCCNYYSNLNLAQNIARADRLMRNLRKLSVSSRVNLESLNWYRIHSYEIAYDYDDEELKIVEYDDTCRRFNSIYFADETSAQNAIDKYHADLLWYFTEFNDSVGYNIDYNPCV